MRRCPTLPGAKRLTDNAGERDHFDRRRSAPFGRALSASPRLRVIQLRQQQPPGLRLVPLHLRDQRLKAVELILTAQMMVKRHL